MTLVDIEQLEARVQEMYRAVAANPHGSFHFEMGRGLAERLGYRTDLLEQVPDEAVDSFAGVGYFFDLAGLETGERVVDLGSGSGTDSFVAAASVGPSGRVLGIDFTPEQVRKARLLVRQVGQARVEFRQARIEEVPAEDASFDCVISNGVINLSADKARVFGEAARLLRPGGRLTIADIVTERPLKESIVCNVDLWASCIGGASQQDDYRAAIENSGLHVAVVRENPYAFLSAQARAASARYGVKSISLLAVKPDR